VQEEGSGARLPRAGATAGPRVSAMNPASIAANKGDDTTSTPRLATPSISPWLPNTAAGYAWPADIRVGSGRGLNSQTIARHRPPTCLSPSSLVKPSGWPVGKYNVEVWLDGVSKGTRDFVVKK
jgi:hypothetical protein